MLRPHNLYNENGSRHILSRLYKALSYPFLLFFSYNAGFVQHILYVHISYMYAIVYRTPSVSFQLPTISVLRLYKCSCQEKDYLCPKTRVQIGALAEASSLSFFSSFIYLFLSFFVPIGSSCVAQRRGSPTPYSQNKIHVYK